MSREKALRRLHLGEIDVKVMAEAPHQRVSPEATDRIAGVVTGDRARRGRDDDTDNVQRATGPRIHCRGNQGRLARERNACALERHSHEHRHVAEGRERLIQPARNLEHGVAPFMWPLAMGTQSLACTLNAAARCAHAVTASAWRVPLPHAARQVWPAVAQRAIITDGVRAQARLRAHTPDAPPTTSAHLHNGRIPPTPQLRDAVSQ